MILKIVNEIRMKDPFTMEMKGTLYSSERMAGSELYHHMIDLREESIKSQLIKMGWTPPKGDKNGTHE